MIILRMLKVANKSKVKIDRAKKLLFKRVKRKAKQRIFRNRKKK